MGRIGHDAGGDGAAVESEPQHGRPEYARNGGRSGYDAKRAHAGARKKRVSGKRSSEKLSVDSDMRSIVEELLIATWSPEQIAKTLKARGGNGLS